MKRGLHIIRAFTVAFAFTVSGCAHGADQLAQGCDANPELQKRRSAELVEIEKADQSDRSGPYDSIDWPRVNRRDLKRRKKVANIFAEGCFKTAADYAHAAMVFQHGTTASHYYQTFIWANEAVKLGDGSQRSLVALGLDRHLVAIGQKQLFGTQLSKDASGKFCLQPVESSFPEAKRIEYIKFNLADCIAFVLKASGSTQLPSETKNCPTALKDSPMGTVPGFW